MRVWFLFEFELHIPPSRDPFGPMMQVIQSNPFTVSISFLLLGNPTLYRQNFMNSTDNSTNRQG